MEVKKGILKLHCIETEKYPIQAGDYITLDTIKNKERDILPEDVAYENDRAFTSAMEGYVPITNRMSSPYDKNRRRGIVRVDDIRYTDNGCDAFAKFVWFDGSRHEIHIDLCRNIEPYLVSEYLNIGDDVDPKKLHFALTFDEYRSITPSFNMKGFDGMSIYPAIDYFGSQTLKLFSLRSKNIKTKVTNDNKAIEDIHFMSLDVNLLQAIEDNENVATAIEDFDTGSFYRNAFRRVCAVDCTAIVDKLDGGSFRLKKSFNINMMEELTLKYGIDFILYQPSDTEDKDLANNTLHYVYSLQLPFLSYNENAPYRMTFVKNVISADYYISDTHDEWSYRSLEHLFRKKTGVPSKVYMAIRKILLLFSI